MEKILKVVDDLLIRHLRPRPRADEWK